MYLRFCSSITNLLKKIKTLLAKFKIDLTMLLSWVKNVRRLFLVFKTHCWNMNCAVCHLSVSIHVLFSIGKGIKTERSWKKVKFRQKHVEDVTSTGRNVQERERIESEKHKWRMRYKENGKRMIFLGVVHPGLRLTVEIWPVIDLAHVPSDGRLGKFFLFFTKIFGWPEIFQRKKKPFVQC